MSRPKFATPNSPQTSSEDGSSDSGGVGLFVHVLRQDRLIASTWAASSPPTEATLVEGFFCASVSGYSSESLFISQQREYRMTTALLCRMYLGPVNKGKLIIPPHAGASYGSIYFPVR